jgi:hypothetical protein
MTKVVWLAADVLIIPRILRFVNGQICGRRICKFLQFSSKKAMPAARTNEKQENFDKYTPITSCGEGFALNARNLKYIFHEGGASGKVKNLPRLLFKHRSIYPNAHICQQISNPPIDPQSFLIQ